MQTGGSLIEPELMQATPRRVRYKKPMRNLRVFVLLLFGFLMGLTLLLTFTDLDELMSLHREGKFLNAHVTKKWVEELRSGKTYHLDYAFEANGRNYRGSDVRTQSEWDTMPEGSPIPIVYLPSDPNVHRIGTGIDARRIADRQDFWIGLDGFVLVIFGGLAVGVEVNLRRERALLSRGVAVAGEIVSGVPLASSPTASRWVTFRYVVSQTETRRKSLLLTALAANRLAGRYTVTVLYDPARPGRASLYLTLQAAEIAGTPYHDQRQDPDGEGERRGR